MMDQEKIGQKIKEIRTKAHLSQAKFASKYNVTYQAVSKWENGKNIPDIAILKQICQDYNVDINDLLGNKPKVTKSKIAILAISLVLLGIIALLIIDNNQSHFEFKKLSASCDDFILYGSIAYNHNKSSIYISNISYCGEDNKQEFQKIECNLFEVNGSISTKISGCNYKENKNISLENFLKNVSFNVDNYEQTCNMYKNNNLLLEINAVDESGNITTYKIPLALEDNCIK